MNSLVTQQCEFLTEGLEADVARKWLNRGNLLVTLSSYFLQFLEKKK
jgi:hypothetical protein